MDNIQVRQPEHSFLALSEKISQDGAINIVQLSIPAVLTAINKMKVDPILADFPFDTASFSEIVFRVIRKGTQLERAALANNLTPESALFFPSIDKSIGKNKTPVQVAIDEILKPMFLLLAEHFGVAFSGNIDSVAYSILTQYGGLSFADLLICFERVKFGRYLKETQHIMTRGINVEFMTSWLNQYCEERESGRQRLYDQYKPDNSQVKSNKDLADKIEKFNFERKIKAVNRDEIKRLSDAIFKDWENGLYTNAMHSQGIKIQQIEVPVLDSMGDVIYSGENPVKKIVRKETLCPIDDVDVIRVEDYPVRVFRTDGMTRAIKRIIFEFIKFGDKAETELFYQQYSDLVESKYVGEPSPEFHVISEFKILLSSFSALSHRISGRDIIESVYRKIHPSASQRQISNSSNATIIEFEDYYFSEYLSACILMKYPRLELNDFLIASTLPIYIEHGFENPFLKLFE